jgi:hypothetical protein
MINKLKRTSSCMNNNKLMLKAFVFMIYFIIYIHAQDQTETV